MLCTIVVISLAFDFTNGWHDAASSIATVVSTRVLRPLWAVVWAAFWNLVAPLTFGTAVAATMGKGLVHLQMVDSQVLLAGLLGAIIWNYATIRLGIPCSSSHALMGGFGGAAISAAGFRAIILTGWYKPILFIFIAPVIGLVAGIFVMAGTSWLVRRQPPRRVDKWFRRLQLLSAAAFSFSHGTNDAQKSMGLITAALVTTGVVTTYKVPDWVIICCALAMAGGTMAGGWRVVKDHGSAHHQAEPLQRIRGGNFRCFDADRHGRRGHSGQLDAGHHRRDFRRGSFAADHGGALGGNAANFVGLDIDHSRRGDHGRGILLYVPALVALI